jgi:hypothetical protein
MRASLTETLGDADAVCEVAYSKVSSGWMHLSHEGRPSLHWPCHDKSQYGSLKTKTYNESIDEIKCRLLLNIQKTGDTVDQVDPIRHWTKSYGEMRANRLGNN